ncbi:hypothetical protein AALO_G00124440 [Alosa alosa]|uniref:Uncharacterized protein n=1 Tax=Alosa alosa TaxID=278164 RepID=A0AAV6GPQ3_9TELE|nr:hypothetical protein AALO_G00124440 [Alosa alosa]
MFNGFNLSLAYQSTGVKSTDMTEKINGAPDCKSYRDAVVAHMPPQPARAPPENVPQSNLKVRLRNVLRRHPDGMLLAQLRRSCPILFQPEVLGSYISTTELLNSMGDVLRIEGFGVQRRVYPVGM